MPFGREMRMPGKKKVRESKPEEAHGMLKELAAIFAIGVRRAALKLKGSENGLKVSGHRLDRLAEERQ